MAALRAGLREHADPAKAEGMRAYLKSELPCLGVYSAAQRLVQREAFAARPLRSRGHWEATARALWDEASVREERNAAIGLILEPRYAGYLDMDALGLLRDLIVDGAWWDLVDPLATKGVRAILEREPERARPVILDWSFDEDMWVRRTAIICQVGRKTDTDLDLLYSCIEPNVGDREFFIRKAIGWALRAYAWTDPREIERYVDEHVSALSRREATKNLPKLLGSVA